LTGVGGISRRDFNGLSIHGIRYPFAPLNRLARFDGCFNSVSYFAALSRL
jgi:hypothetical protein